LHWCQQPYQSAALACNSFVYAAVVWPILKSNKKSGLTLFISIPDLGVGIPKTGNFSSLFPRVVALNNE